MQQELQHDKLFASVTEIAAQMGNAMEGGEMKAALWTMALLLLSKKKNKAIP